MNIRELYTIFKSQTTSDNFCCNTNIILTLKARDDIISPDGKIFIAYKGQMLSRDEFIIMFEEKQHNVSFATLSDNVDAMERYCVLVVKCKTSIGYVNLPEIATLSFLRNI